MYLIRVSQGVCPDLRDSCSR